MRLVVVPRAGDSIPHGVPSTDFRLLEHWNLPSESCLERSLVYGTVANEDAAGG